MSIDSTPTGTSHGQTNFCSVLPKRDLASLAAEQGVRPMNEKDFAVENFWPKEESIDDFLAYVRASRKEEA